MSPTIATDLCGLPKIDFCCNYIEVLHLYKLPASAYYIRYKVRGGAFDLAVEVTQIHYTYNLPHSETHSCDAVSRNKPGGH